MVIDFWHQILLVFHAYIVKAPSVLGLMEMKALIESIVESISMPRGDG